MADGTRTPENDREAELEAGRMPLIEHLIELRNRLIWSFAAIIVAFLICYQFSAYIYAFLARPLADIYAGQVGRRMIFTGLTEAFFTYIKVSFWAAICISFPIIAIQIWKFVAPGLYKNERRAFLPYMFATPILFIAGAALADAMFGQPVLSASDHHRGGAPILLGEIVATAGLLFVIVSLARTGRLQVDRAHHARNQFHQVEIAAAVDRNVLHLGRYEGFGALRAFGLENHAAGGDFDRLRDGADLHGHFAEGKLVIRIEHDSGTIQLLEAG